MSVSLSNYLALALIIFLICQLSRKHDLFIKWTAQCENVYSGICGQWRQRSTYTFVQFDQGSPSANRIIGY